MLEEQLTEVHDAKGTSFLKTCFNMINGLTGLGLITTPYAVSRTGWSSLPFLIVIGMISCYAGILLTRCLDTDASMKTYPDVGFHAFGSKGRIFVSIFQYLELYLIPIGFLIMEADNLERFFPQAGINLGGHHIGGKPFFTMVVGIIILPTMWLKHLRFLAYVSMWGFVSAITIVVSIVCVGVDGVGFSKRGKMFDPTGLPTSLSLFAFCYGVHCVTPSVYSSMRHKNQFYKILFIIFSICTMNYIVLAVLGYLMFGDDAQPQVIMNLPTGKIISKVAIYTTLAIPIIKFALIMTPITNAIENSLPKDWNNMFIFMFIRTLLLVSTVVLAIAFPYFDTLLALVGAILCVTMSMLVPCICYLKIFRLYRKCTVEVAIIGCIMVISVTMGGLGTYTSIKERFS
ncbi:PREDICTED: vacuolar amino acid transporter 1-like isoform X1 [Fragaria vesca subsp. vesca]|uniref:vacuolar amino acid transporter 1-like isoform X1 n=1 Tax=Fragaria vesca subsp. vesca TaxID=101020 RepID=UPI0002C33818|nr:PREDICTED: vacuolar amino acid transporter 1-like isoform X1 [Fragaria vesca subsp. vesca]